VPVPSFRSFTELSAHLRERCAADLDRRLRGKAQTKAELLADDRAAMLPLPGNAFEPRRVEQRRANSLSLVRFDRNDYSVPTAFAHYELTVTGGVERVEISSITAIDYNTNAGTTYTNFLTQASGALPAGFDQSLGPLTTDTLIKATFTDNAADDQPRPRRSVMSKLVRASDRQGLRRGTMSDQENARLKGARQAHGERTSRAGRPDAEQLLSQGEVDEMKPARSGPVWCAPHLARKPQNRANVAKACGQQLVFQGAVRVFAQVHPDRLDISEDAADVVRASESVRRPQDELAARAQD
jgi:hypothetical protein